MAKMEVSCGKFLTVVDDELLESLSKWKWYYDGRYIHRHQHLRMEGKKQIRKKIYLHKIINQTPVGFDTDHINGDKLDNRQANLRSAKRSQNNVNKPKYGIYTSKYKGVCWHKQRGKWRAEIKVNGKNKHLGVFTCEIEAAKVYDDAITKQFGNFAKINFGGNNG